MSEANGLNANKKNQMDIPKIDLPRIVVIGCGFAGLNFCKKINSQQYQVVLLDKNNYHTFQPLMYQVASSGLEADSIVYPIRKVFTGKKHFHFRMTEVQYIDPSIKTVHTSIGDLPYDYLVMATGAANNFFGMDNMEKHAFPMKSLVEALDLRSIILQNFEQALNTESVKERESLMNFVIVGAGATGVELAGALAELKKYILPKDYPDLDIRKMQIHVIEATDKVLGNMSENAAQKSEKFLKKMGVNVWLNTRVADYDGEIVTTDKENLHTRTLIWTAGVKGNVVNGLDASAVQRNRVEVNEQYEVKGHQAIFALGDVARMRLENYPEGHPMLASVAGQQGTHLAKNLNRLAKGQNMLPFKYKDKGTMATIGRNLAVVDMGKIKFAGLFAWFAWMFVHLMLLVDFRSRLVVFVNWAWSYLRYDKGTRLIVRRVERKKPAKKKVLQVAALEEE